MRVLSIVLFASLLCSGIAVASENNAEPLPYTIVCKDAGAGAYEAFPDVCRLTDGRLMAVFYAGYSHVSAPNDSLPNGGQIAACFSSDEGKTWSPARTVIDTPLDDRDPSVVQLPDGRILINFFTDKKVGNIYQMKTCISESSDAGETWSKPRPVYEDYPCSSPIRILSNGTLLLPVYRFKGEEQFGAVGLSTDGGKTWSDPIPIPNRGLKLDAETDVIELKDGSLYALQRPTMAFSLSKDGGKTWSDSETVGFEGHCPYFLRTNDDAILVGLRLWNIKNTNFRISRDECKTWSAPVTVDDCLGAYPSLVNLKDGTVLIVYYSEGTGSDIRARRFRLHSDNTVEWLAP